MRRLPSAPRALWESEASEETADRRGRRLGNQGVDTTRERRGGQQVCEHGEERDREQPPGPDILVKTDTRTEEPETQKGWEGSQDGQRDRAPLGLQLGPLTRSPGPSWKLYFPPRIRVPQIKLKGPEGSSPPSQPPQVTAWKRKCRVRK